MACSFKIMGNVMKKIIPLLLLFALTFFGCGSDGGDDSWEDVKSIEQIAGTWKISLNKTKNAKEFMEKFTSITNDEIDAQMAAAMAKDMKTTYKMDILATVGARTKTLDFSAKFTVSFSGGNVEPVWSAFKAMLIEGYNVYQFEVDDSKYSMTRTLSTKDEEEDYEEEDDEDYEDDELAFLELIRTAMQISSDGKKLRYLVKENRDDEMLFIADMILTEFFDTEEVILIKQ